MSKKDQIKAYIASENQDLKKYLNVETKSLDNKIIFFQHGKALFEALKERKPAKVLIDALLPLDWDARCTAYEIILSYKSDKPHLCIFGEKIDNELKLNYLSTGVDNLYETSGDHSVLLKLINQAQNPDSFDLKDFLSLLHDQVEIDHESRNKLLKYSDIQTLEEVSNQFKEEFRKQLEKDISSKKEVDNEEYLNLMHRWKSSWGTFGFKRMQWICKFCEAKARKKELKKTELKELYSYFNELNKRQLTK